MSGFWYFAVEKSIDDRYGEPQWIINVGFSLKFTGNGKDEISVNLYSRFKSDKEGLLTLTSSLILA